MDVSVGRVIAKARMEKSFTQKDLAQRINEKPQVVSIQGMIRRTRDLNDVYLLGE